MSLSRLLNQPIGLRRRGDDEAGRFGDPQATWGDPVVVYGFLEQVGTHETLADQETVVVTWRVFLPASVEIGPLDQVTGPLTADEADDPSLIDVAAASWLEVDGAPEYVWNPRTRCVSHVRCQLVVVTAGRFR